MNYCGCCFCLSFSSMVCTHFIPACMYHHTKPLLAWIEKVIWTWCFFQCCCCNRYTHLTVRYLSAIAHQSKRCILENEDKWFEENVQPEMALLWKRVRCVLMCTWPTRSNRRRSVNELFMSPSGNTIRCCCCCCCWVITYSRSCLHSCLSNLSFVIKRQVLFLPPKISTTNSANKCRRGHPPSYVQITCSLVIPRYVRKSNKICLLILQYNGNAWQFHVVD